jgi:hypothetical protein
MQVVHYPDLARQSGVIAEVALCGKYYPFRFFDRSGVARKDFHAASGAPRVSSATVKDVDSGIFNRKDELSPILGFDIDFAVRSFGGDYAHQENLRWKILSKNLFI